MATESLNDLLKEFLAQFWDFFGILLQNETFASLCEETLMRCFQEMSSISGRLLFF